MYLKLVSRIYQRGLIDLSIINVKHLFHKRGLLNTYIRRWTSKQVIIFQCHHLCGYMMNESFISILKIGLLLVRIGKQTICYIFILTMLVLYVILRTRARTRNLDSFFHAPY